jgi:hypothetical protein
MDRPETPGEHPGKCGPNLEGMHFGYGDVEVIIQHRYYVLCYR